MRFLPVLLSFLIVVVPQLAGAQDLVGDTGRLVPCSGRDCGTCELIVLSNRVINFIVMIMLALTVVIFAVVGFRMVISKGDPGGWNQAKGALQNVIIGLILILVAWLIVDTGLKLLLKNGGQVEIGSVFGPWNQVPGGACSRQTTLKEGSMTVQGNSWADVNPFIAGDDMTPGQYNQYADLIYKSDNAYASELCTIATTRGLGGYCAVLQAQMFAESAYNPTAVSSAGAAGIYQLLPGTARDMCQRVSGCNFSNLSNAQVAEILKSDPTLSMQLGVEYMAQAFQATNGDVRDALAYYNAGPGGLEPSADCPGLAKWECTINPGGYVETQKYVPRILNAVEASSGTSGAQ